VSSYVVDRGVVIGSGFPHLGAGPDIGAYEFDPMRR
jgi:hypothetical protein